MNEELKAARRLIAAFEALMVGCVDTSFKEWQNGNGKNVGIEIERARKAYQKFSVCPKTDDGDRYRTFIKSGFPIYFCGTDYHDKSSLNAALDAAKGGKK